MTGEEGTTKDGVTPQTPEPAGKKQAIEMHIIYDPKTGNIDVQAPGDPIMNMLIISDALEVMAKQFYATGMQKVIAAYLRGEIQLPEEESLIVKPGLAPVDKRIIEEAQRLSRKS